MTLLMRLVGLISIIVLAGCVDPIGRAVDPLPADLLRFDARGQPQGVARSNLDLADDFLDLTFALENGDKLPALLKYNGRIRVVLRSPGLSTYQPELTALLARLRNEARVDIVQTNTPEEAQIHIHAVPRRTISRVFPGAACFIVPGVRSWSEFRSPQADPDVIMWSRQTALTVTSIFVPADSTPQDTRDCLHEELGQALGPANDLYRIPDTVFNDDNFHSILTPFDMLMLRVLYDPNLQSGMSRAEVAVRLPGILARVNPKGRGRPADARAPESRSWKSSIEVALNRRKASAARISAGERALNLSAAMEPPDHRFGLSLLTLGRVQARTNPAKAVDYFTSAYNQFATDLGPQDIRTTHVALHLALFALKDGQFERALDLADRHIPSAQAAENAVVLSGLLAIKAETLLAAGDVPRARKARLESLAWARYAFGDRDGDIARAQAEIAAFNPGGQTRSVQ